MLEIPVFLYSIMYVLFASAIPLIIMLFIMRKLVKSGRKLIRSVIN